MANILVPMEPSSIGVECLENFKLIDVGSPKWLLQYRHIVLLGLVACDGIKQEVIEKFMEHKKITVLVNEVICARIWQLTVLPALLKINPNSKATLISDIIYHEGAAVSLLDIVLSKEVTWDELGDTVDLIEYCIFKINDFMLKPKNALKDSVPSDIKRQQNEISVKISFRCLKLLNRLIIFGEPLEGLCLHMNKYDVPLLLIDVLIHKPWIHYTSKGKLKMFTGEKWQTTDEIGANELNENEAMVWLLLNCVITQVQIADAYEISDIHVLKFQKCLDMLTPLVFDRLPHLHLLKKIFKRAVSFRTFFVPNASIILDQKPTIFERFNDELVKHGGCAEIAKRVEALYFSRNAENLDKKVERLSPFSDTDALDDYFALAEGIDFAKENIEIIEVPQIGVNLLEQNESDENSEEEECSTTPSNSNPNSYYDSDSDVNDEDDVEESFEGVNEMDNSEDDNELIEVPQIGENLLEQNEIMLGAVDEMNDIYKRNKYLRPILICPSDINFEEETEYSIISFNSDSEVDDKDNVEEYFEGVDEMDNSEDDEDMIEVPQTELNWPEHNKSDGNFEEETECLLTHSNSDFDVDDQDDIEEYFERVDEMDNSEDHYEMIEVPQIEENFPEHNESDINSEEKTKYSIIPSNSESDVDDQDDVEEYFEGVDEMDNSEDEEDMIEVPQTELNWPEHNESDENSEEEAECSITSSNSDFDVDDEDDVEECFEGVDEMDNSEDDEDMIEVPQLVLNLPEHIEIYDYFEEEAVFSTTPSYSDVDEMYYSDDHYDMMEVPQTELNWPEDNESDESPYEEAECSTTPSNSNSDSDVDEMDNSEDDEDMSEVPEINVNLAEQSRRLTQCSICKKYTNLKCGFCLGVHYCSKACQSQDWNRHEPNCHQN